MNLTKQYICDTFWSLLEETPYAKITVTLLVERCHINRNTFYYHFHNIPDLLTYSIHKWATTILHESFDPEKPLNTIDPFISGILARKRAFLHIYRSAEQEAFVAQLRKSIAFIHDLYFKRVAEESTMDAETVDTLTWFYRTASTGVILDWLEHDMDYDLSARIHNYNAFLIAISGKNFSERLAAIGSRTFTDK